MVIKLYDSPPIVDSSKFTGSDLSSPEVSSQPTWYTPSTTASNINALNQRLALASNSNSTKTKLPPIPSEVTFTAIGCDTEKKLAVAGYMAMAAKAGIADVNAQRKFALNMTKDGFELKATPKEKPSYELTDRKVDEDYKGKRATFVSSKANRDALEDFRRRYIESGGKIRANSHPTIDIRTANIDAVSPVSSVTSKTRFTVYLDNNGRPVTNERILAQYAQDRHPSGNIWGDKYREIGQMSSLQGVKADLKNRQIVGNKIKVDFDLSPEDQFKVQENYKIVQAEMNEVDAFRAKYNQENPLSQFILGTFDGAYASITGNVNAILHPVETLSQIKEAISVLSSLTSEDIAKIYEQVKDSATTLVTTKDGINSLPYKSGYIVGMGVAELITAKGVGAVLKGIKGVPAITNLVNKAEDLAALSKAKILEEFSDEAAALAGERARKALSTQLYSGFPADAMADLAIVAGNKIKNGVVKFSEFSRQMVAEYGEKIRPKLLELYQDSFEKVVGTRKDLGLDELLGGHTIERHTGKSDNWLRARLLSEQKTSRASTFTNEAIANRTIGQFVKEQRDAIEKWITSGEPSLNVDYVADQSVGKVLGRGKGNAPLGKPVETNRVRFVLVRDNTPQGWHLYTSFPIPPKGGFKW